MGTLLSFAWGVWLGNLFYNHFFDEFGEAKYGRVAFVLGILTTVALCVAGAALIVLITKAIGG